MENKKKYSILANSIEKIFVFLKPKVINLLLFLFHRLFPKFQKQNLMYFGRKYIETGSSCSHEVPIFFSIICPQRKYFCESQYEFSMRVHRH